MFTIMIYDFHDYTGLIFLETSAKTGDSVEEAFLKCSKTILAKIQTGELDPDRMGSGIQYGDAALRGLQRSGSTAGRRSIGGVGAAGSGSRAVDCCKF